MVTVPETQLRLLGSARFDEAVDALCAAFHDYPVMRYILKDAGEDYDAQLRELVGWFTAKRVTRGRPVLGALRGGRVLAVANIDPPDALPEPPELRERFRRMESSLGVAAMTRFHAFEGACAPLTPPEPHVHVGMLGVRPEHQGEGLGGLLLQTAQSMSLEDPRSKGVGLTTETPDNVPFYERFGYRVLGRANAEELETWSLFRPDRAGDDWAALTPIIADF